MSVNLTISLKHLNAVLAVLNRHIEGNGEECVNEECEFYCKHGDEVVGLPNYFINEDGRIKDEDVSNAIEALKTANIGQGDKYIDILYARDFINQVESSNILKKNSEEAEEQHDDEEEEEEDNEEEECSCSPPLSQCGNCIAKMREAYKNDNRPSCEKCHSKDNTSILKFGAHYHRTCDDCMDSFEGDAIAFDKYPTDTRSKRHIKYARR